VLLLWLVCASGVNGYMLPWDRLAQFVLTATGEWFDALPPFRGTACTRRASSGWRNSRTT
jgi:quinol-cytochrome oxidoreductase complex cytochrome b subunit